MPGTNAHTLPPIVTVAPVPNDDPPSVKIVPPDVEPVRGVADVMLGAV